MKIKVLFFGVLSDVVGHGSISINGVNNIDELNMKLVSDYPELEKHTYRMAINQNMAEPGHGLSENDTVAIMPPFAGG